MLNSVQLDLSRVTDSHFNWKTTSKGRPRAVRRARTSFAGGNKDSTSRSSKEREGLTEKDFKRARNMMLSEAEKAGGSILGQHFSDTLERVPIKKRRFLLVRSPSSPPQSPRSGISDQIREMKSDSHPESASNTNHHVINNGVEIELGQEMFSIDEKPNLEGLNEKLCESADFSGTSILSTAACASNIGGDAMNVEDPVSLEPKSQEKEEKNLLKEDLDCKVETPLDTSATFSMPVEELEAVKVGGLCSLDTSLSSSQNVPSKTTKVGSSSREDRLHWDLNTVMDAWESHPDECSVNCSYNDVHLGQVSEIKSLQTEKHASLHSDSGNGMIDRCSVVCGISGDIAPTNVLKEIGSGSTGKFEEERVSPFTPHSHGFHSQEFSNHDELSSGGVHATKNEATDDDMEIRDNKCSPMDGTTKPTAADSYGHIVYYEVPISNSIVMKPGMVRVPSLNYALDFDEFHKNHLNVYVTNTCQVDLEYHSDCVYSLDASQIDSDESNGMEKIESMRDDNYQYDYEDSEFRESFPNRLGEDGAMDGESEYVDYGSDRERDIPEAASEFPASVSLHVESIEGKIGLSDANCKVKDGAHARKEIQDAVSEPLIRCSLDAGSAKRKINIVCKNLVKDDEDASNSPGVLTEVIGEERFLYEGDASRKLSRLSEGFRVPESGVMVSGVDSLRRNQSDASLGTFNADEPFRRVLGSSLRKGTSSRDEKLRSSNTSSRQDKLYDRASRCKDQNDFDADTPTSIGRGASSRVIHGLGKHDQWVDFPEDCGPNQRGRASFRHPTSMNAAAAAVAKLESNGFVVATDGTILKAGGVRPACRAYNRPTKASSYNSQHAVSGRRYQSRDAPLPLNQSPTREQSFSSHRNPLERSRTRSPLRSRIHSPHMHISLRSPHLRSDLVEHMVHYTPTSRIRNSPPHASRWVDGRDNLSDHFREHGPNRYQGRSSSRQNLSQNHRLHLMDSLGRAKSNENYRSVNSGTHPKFVDFDCEFDDRRGSLNKYEMLHSLKDTDGNTKHFQPGAENGFRVHNTRLRPS